ncbi:hypothetical protein M8J77_014089 [Diaphorina citri]|nr:hypothetical protein M8J77_014089 [Diaphorina citri]
MNAVPRCGIPAPPLPGFLPGFPLNILRYGVVTNPLESRSYRFAAAPLEYRRCDVVAAPLEYRRYCGRGSPCIPSPGVAAHSETDATGEGCSRPFWDQTLLGILP